MTHCEPIPRKPRDIVCNVDDMSNVNGSWIVSFYDSDTGDSAGYDSTEFDSMSDAVEYAEATRRYAINEPGDHVTVVIDGNG